MSLDARMLERSYIYGVNKAFKLDFFVSILSVFWVRPHTRGCPSRCFRSRTVSTTVAKWFVPIARGTVDKVYRFGPLRDA
jgi:hypothetical protein